MKVRYNSYSILGLLVVLIFSCKKKKEDDNSNNNVAPVFCSLSPSTCVVNDTVKQIILDTSLITSNNTFHSEHLVAIDEGISADFEGSTFPLQGKYAITSSFNEVKVGSKKVYIQYFKNGEAYVGQTGEVEIDVNSIIYLCKITFKNTFGETFEVSLKSTIK